MSTTENTQNDNHLKVLATHDNLIVKDYEKPDITPGGVHLPSLRKESATRKGLVLAVGPGQLLPDYSYQNMQIQVGDVILYSSLHGTVITLGENEYTVVSERSVLAVQREEDKA
jgi:co-chaperonin GroES (HSP10)